MQVFLRTGNQEDALMGYVFIIFIIALLIVATINKLNKYYPLFIYLVGLLAIWQTTSMGKGLVGSDIWNEFYFVRQSVLYGWDHTIQSLSNASLINPLSIILVNYLQIDIFILFKYVYPAIFALVPVILYLSFKKQMQESKAFIASLFFVVIPTYSLEIAGIAKSQIAEVFLALFVLILVSDLKIVIKSCFLFVIAVLCIMFHYTVGIILLGYFLGIIAFGAMGKLVRIKNFDTKWHLGISLIPVIIFAVAYFNFAGDGILLTTVKTIATWSQSNVLPASPAVIVNQVIPSTNQTVVQEIPQKFYLFNQPSMVRAGIGLDFIDASVLGKVFRILQYLTELLIVLGAIWIIFKSKSFRSEFVAGIVSALALLALCVFFPNFAAIANMTRFYHLSLFFLAPCLVFGLQWFYDN